VTEFLQFTVIGVITGSIYAISASGLVLTYTTTGVFNFAHGAVGMAAAYAYYWLRVQQGVPTLVALAAVVLVLAPAAGAVTERVMRRFRGAPPALSLVATIALTLLLIGLAQTAFDARTSRRLPAMFGDHSLHVAGVVVTYDQVAFLLVAVVVAIGLRWLLRRTRIGMTMRATVDNAALVELCGAGAESVARMSWALGYLLAAAAGVLLASGQPLVAEVLAFLVINAYAAATFGRMRSLPLTIAGALALGLVQSWTNVGFLFPSGEAWDRVRLAIPGLFLLGSLLALPEARLAAARATGRSIRIPSARSSWLGAAALVAAMVLVASAAPAARVTDVARGVVIAIPMLSLVLLSGYGGQISLATYVFMALGAWTLSHVALGGGSVGLVLGGVVAVPIGVLVALPALRLQGLYLALATFAFALAGRELLIRDPHIFGGNPRAVLRPHFLGMSFNGDGAFLVLATAVFVVLGLAVVAVRRRALGRRLYAMRDSEMACATLGMNLRLLKLGLFAASAAIAGIGGAFVGSFNRSVGDTQWEPLFNIVIFLFVFVAGIDSVAGALIGGLLLSLSGLVQSEHPAIAGLVFAGVATVAIQLGRQPSGLVGLVSDRARAARRAIGATSSAGTMTSAATARVSATP
jgi:branched-chain amino acid transport system permease protein